MSSDDVDWLLGHRPKAIARAYWEVEEERMTNLYIEKLPFLTFNDIVEIEAGDTERIKALEEEVRNNKETFNKTIRYFSNIIDDIKINRGLASNKGMTEEEELQKIMEEVDSHLSEEEIKAMQEDFKNEIENQI